MDRTQLEEWIAEGLSLQQMGVRAGRHPSTVSYWLRKHGLRAVGADMHAARGPLGRDELAQLVEAGFSVREIAQVLGRSATTIRHWLRAHGLATRLAEIRKRVASADGGDLELRCRKHGTTTFRMRTHDRGYRCVRCQSEQVIDGRRRVRARLVAEAGGACTVCGYQRYIGALHFHHLDPSTKSFEIGGGATRSLARNRAEVAKCVLLCSNCHAEVEAGLISLASGADKVADYRVAPSPR